ncbi:MAG: hypothetical protein VX964_06010 [Verrucomicrobiota bacterium]|nr:hypothetical protein [Verrucomicrobiota bacterium]
MTGFLRAPCLQLRRFLERLGDFLRTLLDLLGANPSSSKSSRRLDCEGGRLYCGLVGAEGVMGKFLFIQIQKLAFSSSKFCTGGGGTGGGIS